MCLVTDGRFEFEDDLDGGLYATTSISIGVFPERGISTQTLTGGLILHIIEAYCAFILRNSVMSRTYKVTATTSVNSKFLSCNMSKK